MSKPKTAYTSTTKPQSAYTALTKPETAYTRSSAGSGWLLNSTVVTLNSSIYYLNGFTTATPNLISFKNKTAYTPV